MGVSLGGGYKSSDASSTSSSTDANTYSAPQTGVQSQVGSNLSTDLSAAAAGKLTPGTVAQETSADDAVNKTSSGLTDRVNSFLAAKGLGKSGETGKTTLQGELGRESTIGSNAATFAGQQNGLNQSNLLAALNYAFTSLGSSTAGQAAGNSSTWGVEGGASV